MVERLTHTQVQDKIKSIDGWVLSGDGAMITRSYKFKDFDTAWNFMMRVADIAKDLNHHPEWSNVYNRVEICLTTHDVGGLSDLDFQMACAINGL